MAACAVMGAATAATAITRIVADRHYFSDGLIGAAIGFATGYGLPWLLHYRAGLAPEGTPPTTSDAAGGTGAVRRTGHRRHRSPGLPVMAIGAAFPPGRSSGIDNVGALDDSEGSKMLLSPLSHRCWHGTESRMAITVVRKRHARERRDR